ncbi:MAG: tetratricopeptide repeat protein [Deltaproteobacteria bacterium]|nr:tetratricopeptide repeat protein [Deltaproteobacteria bacterium]
MSRIMHRIVAGRRKARPADHRALLTYAQQALDRGNDETALSAFEAALRLQPGDSRVRLKIAAVLVRRGNTKGAIEAYSRAAEGLVHDAHERKAISVYGQLLALDPSNRNAHLRLGDLYRHADRDADALAEYREALDLCRSAGRDDEICALLERIAMLDPRDLELRVELARRRRDEGNSEAATRSVAELLAEFDEPHDPERVARAASAILSELPGEPQALECLIGAHLRLAELERARELIDESLPQLRDPASLRERLAKAYEAAGDSEAAERTWTELAQLYGERGDQELVREILQRHVHSAELAPQPLCPAADEAAEEEPAAAAEVLELQDPVEEPVPPCAPTQPPAPAHDVATIEPAPDDDTSGHFTTSTTLHREEAQAHQDLAVAFMRMDAWERALEELEHLHRYPGREVDALYLKAACATATGRREAAVAWLEEALARVGAGVYAAVPLRYELAEALCAAGRSEEALDSFREVSLQGPGFRDVEQRVAELTRTMATAGAAPPGP